jgi:hypothetical protein
LERFRTRSNFLVPEYSFGSTGPKASCDALETQRTKRETGLVEAEKALANKPIAKALGAMKLRVLTLIGGTHQKIEANRGHHE